jgi:hypothetical protein
LPNSGDGYEDYLPDFSRSQDLDLELANRGRPTMTQQSVKDCMDCVD